MNEAHDPRLDASGEEHPGVRPSNFDLIALERTRYGLRGIGLGLFVLSLAAPFISRHFSGGVAWQIAGWITWAVGLLIMAVAVRITAPTPHGPLPGFVIQVYVCICIASFSSTFGHLFQLFTSSTPNDASRIVSMIVDIASLIAFASLSTILWRFCQFRGLSGRAIVWLWVAMAMYAAGAIASSTESRAIWAFPLLGLIAFFAARQTARDVWLDAVYRHSKFFVVTNPQADVVPLHPADKH